MSRERFVYIDTAKAYLIFLVILGHVLIVLNPDYSKLYLRVIQEYIYAFHMPAFYMIHGLVFNNEKWKRASTAVFIRKRLYSLLVPYLFFEMIGIVWKAIFQQQSFLTGLYNMVTIRCNVGADWFLPAMFLGSCLFLLYVKHPNRIYGLVSAIVCLILPAFMSGSQLRIVFGRALLAYGFMMIGNLAKELFTSEKTKGFRCFACALVITGIVAIINIKFGGNDFFSCSVHNPLTFVIGGVSGTLLMISFSHWVHCKWSSEIGKHTLTIMGTHQLVIYAMTALTPGMYGGSLTWGGILLVIIIVFEIPAVYLIDRYLPFFVGRKNSLER